MNHHSTPFGNLNCHLIDALAEGEPPQLGVLLCHGFGAPGTDLVGLGSEILRSKPALQNKVQFLFPEAPLSLDDMGMYDARAWWHLDVMAMNATIAQGNLRDLRSDIPEGMPAAREMLIDTVTDYQKQSGLPLSRIVLGGFSQGSMITTDIALRLEEPPAALVIFSGTLLMEDEWSELATNRKEMQVLQSHGTEDQILPYCGAEWLRDLLISKGLHVDFLSFAGGHTIPMEGLSHFATMLETLCKE